MSTTNPAGPGRNPVVVSTETSAPALHSRSSSTALRLGSSGQWGAIAAGAFTGLAVTITMATLGAALGMTASAAAADHASDSGFGRDGVVVAPA